ncbi:LysR family transcriptional regulator [Mesorhizobium sp. M0601]|uniref:LysR family transcriptional regulator n=1 Tax=Mesorhizobium sp. M0601 TaxID=2956969 RepID=UPI003337950F
MQLRHLKTFVAVATTLNITRASERVHLAQSSVTEQIQALESDLGTSLFDRSRRGLKLTAAGQRLLDYANDLLDLADEARSAVADASGTVAGRLTVGGLETLCSTRLPALLGEFHRRHPDVELNLRADDSSGLRAGVTSGALDVSFHFGAVPAAAPELRSEQVALEELVTIMPANHRLAGYSAITPDDLADEAFLVTQPGCVYRRMFDETFAATLSDRPKLVGEFASMGAIRSLVEGGLGCALVPRLVASAADANIVVLPWVGSSPVTPVTMVWRHRRIQAPVLRLFLAMVREILAIARPVAGHHRHEARFR